MRAIGYTIFAALLASVPELSSCQDEVIDWCGRQTIDIARMNGNKGIIKLQNCTFDYISWRIDNIPEESWFGIFLEEIVREDISSLEFEGGEEGDDISVNIKDLKLNTDNKMDRLVYPKSAPRHQNITIKIQSHEGKNITLMFEFIVASVIGRAGEVNGSKGSVYVVSHAAFDGQTDYTKGIDASLNITGLVSVLQVTWLYFDVHQIFLGWCDDYLILQKTARSKAKSCGTYTNSRIDIVNTYSGQLGLKFVTSDYWLDPGEKSGFLIAFEGTDSSNCPPVVRNAVTNPRGPNKYSITCNTGYELDNGSTRSTLVESDDNVDCDLIKECSAIICPQPQNWNATFVEFTFNQSAKIDEGPTVGNIIGFKCSNTSYELFPNNITESKCQEDRTWSHDFPECRRVVVVEPGSSTSPTENSTNSEIVISTTSPSPLTDVGESTTFTTDGGTPAASSLDEPTLIGLVVGGAALLILIVAIVPIVIMYRKRKSRMQKEGSDDDELRNMTPGASATDNGVYFSPPSLKGAASQTKTVDENVYHLANDEALDNYENAAEIQRTNEAADMADNYTDVLAANKKPRFTAAQELIDNDLYSS